MATFVDLTPAACAAGIRRSGIKARGGRRGVCLFPVPASCALTHQWLREPVRRPGSRGIVAVQVGLPDGEPASVVRCTPSGVRPAIAPVRLTVMAG
ncbi:hypothetical protein GCM10010275_14060 [Streptomyces litmocidini]|uniref:hypothetical protein n=1 Tax=Streptomyces litmocidini TaxID=67318 RepID=UPI00167E647C|nr:hypothetical protein [Streptomyces litmocidini]GGU80500.1 hypothetical protein GCM10010275_14060 [Streptomyces litmocidini]